MDDCETRLTESILIFTVEGDDAIQLKIGGVKIGAWGPSCKQAIALLKLEAELRTLRSVEPPPDAINLLRLILPLAKGYAYEHPVGSNRQYVNDAEEFLATQWEAK